MDYLVRDQRYSACTVNLIYTINLCGCFGRKHTDDRCLLQPQVAECRGQSTTRLTDVNGRIEVECADEVTGLRVFCRPCPRIKHQLIARPVMKVVASVEQTVGDRCRLKPQRGSFHALHSLPLGCKGDAAQGDGLD